MSKHTKEAVEAAFAEAVKEDTLCPVGKVLVDAGPEVRKVLEQKLADNLHYSTRLIVRVLKGLGYPPISPDSMNRHRKNECRCQS